MMNLFSQKTNLLLTAIASSTTMYLYMKHWKGAAELLHGYLARIITSDTMEEEYDPLKAFQELFSGPLPVPGPAKFPLDMDVSETRIIMAVDDDGDVYWSRFDEGEWEILMAYIMESDTPSEDIIAEVMTDRLEAGKVSFGNPLFDGEDDD